MQVLKPVNQRAQGRVPPPDDVDLDRAIDGSALNRLLAVEVRDCLLLSKRFGERALEEEGGASFKVVV